MEYKILINSVEKVHAFQNAIATLDGDFDLISSNACVDARSFLGIMTLNIAQPLILKTNSESEQLVEELEDYILE